MQRRAEPVPLQPAWSTVRTSFRFDDNIIDSILMLKLFGMRATEGGRGGGGGGRRLQAVVQGCCESGVSGFTGPIFKISRKKKINSILELLFCLGITFKQGEREKGNRALLAQ